MMFIQPFIGYIIQDRLISDRYFHLIVKTLNLHLGVVSSGCKVSLLLRASHSTDGITDRVHDTSTLLGRVVAA